MLAASRHQLSGFFCPSTSPQVFSLFLPRMSGKIIPKDNPPHWRLLSPLPLLLGRILSPDCLLWESEHLCRSPLSLPTSSSGNSSQASYLHGDSLLSFCFRVTWRQLPRGAWYRFLVAEGGQGKGAVSLQTPGFTEQDQGSISSPEPPHSCVELSP